MRWLALLLLLPSLAFAQTQDQGFGSIAPCVCSKLHQGWKVDGQWLADQSRHTLFSNGVAWAEISGQQRAAWCRNAEAMYALIRRYVANRARGAVTPQTEWGAESTAFRDLWKQIGIDETR